jgi:hypothetical protein
MNLMSKYACSIASAVLALDPCAVDASSLAIVNLI